MKNIITFLATISLLLLSSCEDGPIDYRNKWEGNYEVKVTSSVLDTAHFQYDTNRRGYLKLEKLFFTENHDMMRAELTLWGDDGFLHQCSYNFYVDKKGNISYDDFEDINGHFVKRDSLVLTVDIHNDNTNFCNTFSCKKTKKTEDEVISGL